MSLSHPSWGLQTAHDWPGTPLDAPRPFHLTLHSAKPSPTGSEALIRLHDCFPEGPWPLAVSRYEGRLLVSRQTIEFKYVGPAVTIQWFVIWPPMGSEWDGLQWLFHLGKHSRFITSGDPFKLNIHGYWLNVRTAE